MTSTSLRGWFLTGVLTGVVIGTAWAQEKKTTEKQGVLRLPEVVVSATRLPDVLLDLSRFPAQVRVLTEEEIEASGARTVPEVIQYQPGITLYQNVGNAFEPTLDMRGFSAEPVPTTTVILDGVRVNNPDFNGVNFDLIPVEDLERIEVIPGTASIFGKNALAGVVNLATKRGGPVPQAKLEVAGGSFGHTRYRGSVGGPVGDFDYYLGFTQVLEDGFRDDSDADGRRLFTKVGRRVGAETDITLSYLFVEDHLEQAGSLREDLLEQDRTQNQTPGDFAEHTLHAATLNLRRRLPAGFSVALNTFVRDLDRESFVVGLTSISRTLTDILTGGGTVQLTHEATPFGHRNVFVAGVEYAQSQFVSTGSSRFIPFPPSFSNRETDEQVLGLYFQESFDLIPEVLILSGGGRYDQDRIDFTDRLDPTKDRIRTFRRFNPVAGLTVNVTRDIGLYFSYSEGFRTPTVEELFAFAPFSSNPDLKPLKSRAYEVGGRIRLGKFFEGSLALFQTDVKNDIFFVVTDPSTGGGLNENVDKTRRRGVEVGLKGRYGGLVNGFVNYSFIKPTFETDILLSSGQVRKGNDIPLIPRHRLGMGVNVRPIDGLTLSLTGLFVSDRFLSGDEPNRGKRLDDYFVMNGRVSYRRGPLTLFLQGENILDAEYEPWGVLSGGNRFLMPAPGASFLAGVSYGFSGPSK
ncbi:MAG: TonB-dependent receptor [Candidatus Methylomirabilales bacterium]